MILYEDEAVIVCHKPAGVAVQSAKIGQKDMVSILSNHLARGPEICDNVRAEGTPGEDVPGKEQAIYPVHRLDQPVEGVIVFAKNRKAAASLSRQAADGSMKKIYRAVCCATGKIPGKGDRRRLVDYLIRDGRTNTSFVAGKDGRDAKRAELSFSVLSRKTMGNPYILAEIELMTGRHHQIRVQMAHAGLPLYGDQKYNVRWREFLVPPDAEDGKVFPALCAVSLSFAHPVTGERVTFRTDPQAGIFRMMEDAQNA